MTDFLTALRRCEEAAARLEKTSHLKGQYVEQRHSHLLTDFEAAKRALIAFPGKQEMLSLEDNRILVSKMESLLRELSSTQEKNGVKRLLDRLVAVSLALESPQKAARPALKGMPPEIRSELQADIDETHRCFDAKCFRSCVILCGRILETALHRKYYDVTKNDLLEKSPGIGLGNLVSKLHEKGILVDPAIAQQIHLINQVRIYSVHTKKEPFAPSEEQAHAIMLYTVDILKKLF
ncbi:MAG: DUF4145 domain-containing protein [Nanoarchaeota archaeon]|nr:DUF4145 domain-containing protein [Nanoarchaeota archaeon]